jgi:lipopolysaccharide transport system ATP-binding protein
LTGLRIGFELINEDKELIIFRSFHDENAEDILQTKPGLYKTKAQIPGLLLKNSKYIINICIGIHNVRWIIFDLIRYRLSVHNIGGINKIYADQRPGLIMPKIYWSTEEFSDEIY